MRQFAGFAAMLASVAGCYTLRPAASEPPTGSRIAIGLNDEGRVAMGGAIGPEIDQIQGTLIDGRNGEYVVAVRAVRFLRGGEQVWAGERVRINREHVRTTYRREFSRGRTLAFVGTTLGAVGLFIAGRNAGLIAIGGDREPKRDDGGSGGSLRIRTWTLQPAP